MKLMTWNIQWGRGTDGQVDLARLIAEARRIANFDVLCLQEVADNFPELAGSSGENQFAEISRLLPGYSVIEGIAVDIPGTDGRRQRFGNAIATRLPVGRIMRHILPWDADTTLSMTRGLLEVVVHAHFGPLRILTTHLEYFSSKIRRAQVDAVRAIVAQGIDRAATQSATAAGPYAPQAAPAATVLVGDFNMKPDDPVKALLAEPLGVTGGHMVDAWIAANGTKPHPISACVVDQTSEPPHCCDFVYLSEDLVPRLAAISYDGETRASDHQPAMLELS